MSYKFEIYFGRFSKAGLQGPRGVTNSIWPWIPHCLHFVSCSNVIYFKTRALNLFLSFLKILFFNVFATNSYFQLQVAAGSSDRFLYIWDTTSRRVLYKLPGHNGSVNDVDFHRTEPIVLSASSDKQLYLGEIDK